MAFIPKSPPDGELKEYLQDLEFRIADAFESGEFETLNLKEFNVAIDKPRNGEFVYADGTNWDPGSGQGLYRHDGSTYTKVG